MATASVSCCVFSSAGERVCGPPLSARARGWQRGSLPPALSVPRLKERAPALKPLPWRRIQPVIAMGGRHYLVQKVSGEELNKLLDANRESSVVVGFYATWCGPCITIAQELEQLAVEFEENVKFVKVDTDEEYELANSLQVRGLPTVLFVSKDTQKKALRTEGVLPREVYRNIIMNEL